MILLLLIIKKLKEIPMVILLPTTTKTGPQFKWPDSNKYPLTNSPLTAANLANYFNKILPYHRIPIPEPDLENIFILVLIIIGLLLIFNFYPYRNQKNFWMWVCYFIIWFSLSGNFWNLSRGPPLTYGNSLIYPQQRQQTLLESFIAGTLLMIICAVFTTFDSEVMPLKTKPSEQKQIFYKVGGLFVLLVMSLNIIWLHKIPWYLRYA